MEKQMYLHLGQDVIVDSNDVIGIFDLENTSTSKFTKEFLRQADAEMEIVTVSYEMPRSFILCGKKNKMTLYISQISSTTLLKRAANFLKDSK